jgi:4-hydroxy-3-polyprenylbenzoate decarboxylase
MHRENPILRQHNTLMFSDHQPLISLPHEALLYARLRERAAVHDVFYVPWGGTLACVVKMTPAADGEVRGILQTVLDERWPNARLAMAVDDDVDIGSAEDLVWSLTTRVDPARDLLFVPGVKGHPIDPLAVPTGVDPREVITNKWAIDATRPPTSQPDARARFERTVPPFHDDVRLADYLEK